MDKMEVEEEEEEVLIVPESPPIHTQDFGLSSSPLSSSARRDVVIDMLDLEETIVDEDFDIDDSSPPGTPPPDDDFTIEEVQSQAVSKPANYADPFDDDCDLDLLARVEFVEHEQKEMVGSRRVSEADEREDGERGAAGVKVGGQVNRSVTPKAHQQHVADVKASQAESERLEMVCREQFRKLVRMGPNARIFPDVRPSNFHTVTFLITADYVPGDNLVAHPAGFRSKWDPLFVPMPCANENNQVIRVRQQRADPDQVPGRVSNYQSTATGGSSINNWNQNPGQITGLFVEKTIWIWDRIYKSLTLPMRSCQDISSSIKQYCRGCSDFKALDYCIETLMSAAERTHFFDKVLPCMQTLCVDLKKFVTCPVPLLLRFSNYSVSLSQKQIASLLANAFFCTFPKRIHNELHFPTINFVELFQHLESEGDFRLVTKAHKIRCILNYFTRVADEMPKGVVTYTRRSIRNSKAPDWATSTKKLSTIIPLLKGTIEDDGVGLLQVDFANKMVGGGVIGGGAVQEEILFVIYPELLISRLLAEKLTACEALVVTGCERFSSYSGYASSFKYAGDYFDVNPVDSKGRKCTQIVAIDALYITKPISQFHPKFLTRELNKAFVGFSSPTLIPIATGKWGCGAFNGNPQLKAILQLLAASQAGKDLVFFTFGDVRIQIEIQEMYLAIKDNTVQQVWTVLNQYYSLCCSTSSPKYNLHQFITRLATGSFPSSSTKNVNYRDDDEPSGSKKFKEVPITNFYTPDFVRQPHFNGHLPKSQSHQTYAANNPSPSTSLATTSPNTEVHVKPVALALAKSKISEMLEDDDFETDSFPSNSSGSNNISPIPDNSKPSLTVQSNATSTLGSVPTGVDVNKPNISSISTPTDDKPVGIPKREIKFLKTPTNSPGSSSSSSSNTKTTLIDFYKYS